MPPRLSACSTAADVVAASGNPDLTGRTVVVTGGASGIGVETTRRLAALGARVVLGVRNTAAGEAVAAQLKAEGVKVCVWGGERGGNSANKQLLTAHPPTHPRAPSRSAPWTWPTWPPCGPLLTG